MKTLRANSVAFTDQSAAPCNQTSGRIDLTCICRAISGGTAALRSDQVAGDVADLGSEQTPVAAKASRSSQIKMSDRHKRGAEIQQPADVLN